MNSSIQKLITGWTWLSSLVLASAFAAIVVFLLRTGLPAVDLRLIFGDTPPRAALLLQRPVLDGLLPAMAGTLFLVLTAVSLAVPVGISAGIYLAEYSRGRAKQFLSLLFDILAGIPSIVVGLAGFCLAVFLHHHLSDRIYPCLLISALSLAFLVLPYLIRSTQTALESLPVRDRIAAPALGASKLQNIVYVLVPRALDGIVNGVVLSIGRCAEDTAVIMLTGAVATAGIPNSLLGSYEALPFFIYYISSQYMDRQELLKGYAAALILLTLCAALFALSLIIKNVLARRLHNRV
ncbi:MAG: ABC transporter permease subunit [Desulfosarcinaceae bacterium]